MSLDLFCNIEILGSELGNMKATCKHQSNLPCIKVQAAAAAAGGAVIVQVFFDTL